VAASPLIDVAGLSAHLEDPEYAIVDCRFDLLDPAAGRRAYRAGHIPGARYADLEQDLSAPPLADQGRHPLPDPDDLAARLGAMSISNASHIVAYDDCGGALAARLWWLARWIGHERVSVLDGGLGAWLAAGHSLEEAVRQRPPSRFTRGRVREEWVASSDELPGLLAQGVALLDARAAERYRGEREPIDPIAGHVPGARSLPFSSLLTAGGRFKHKAALQREFESVMDGRATGDVVTMCGSGVTACHLLLALRVAERGDGKLYAGSWSEWIRDPSRAVATGAEP
jgi:thiosulfate/3-mercaptopyruvate sulfurtransferase